MISDGIKKNLNLKEVAIVTKCTNTDNEELEGENKQIQKQKLVYAFHTIKCNMTCIVFIFI